MATVVKSFAINGIDGYPIAIGVLQQNGDIAIKDMAAYSFIGELSLDGRLRACRGILPMVIAAKKHKISKIIVPSENMCEAKLVHGIEVFGFSNLVDVIRFLERKQRNIGERENDKVMAEETANAMFDFSDVKDQEELVDAVVLATPGEVSLAHNGVLFLYELAEFSRRTLILSKK